MDETLLQTFSLMLYSFISLHSNFIFIRLYVSLTLTKFTLSENKAVDITKTIVLLI